MTTATAKDPTMTQTWQPLCTKADLVAHSGVAAWIETPEGPVQVAVFYLPAGPDMPGPPGQATELFAVDHHDPFSDANVIARGIVGDIQGEPVVASPIYKQHFRLADGQCVEDESVRLRCWPLRFEGERVLIDLG
ncbi:MULTISPECIES: nitrite reductase small subunit NirD [Halomonadaceae]|jgi:nitrite reductase (NADH) small subunit|uniref:nitrite reductase small subunit NirD n=1 Tax=Halomonadaceae TaxID=28256 RepID=UPI001583DB51|nr:MULTISPECIES: nitrite reductase small subunit NirD [Halomonas]MDI4636858.1 nitrite reductase small subunit NirD [Halomonas sp. BMC7]NUJ58026.1 nitrite reductase small subunit NirD [Halomonas taeanensis]